MSDKITAREIQESMQEVLATGARTDDQLAWLIIGARIAQRHHAIIEMMREIARRFGWAIGVHGSLIRDIDLIAVPWTADASDWTVVYDAWLAEMPLQDTEGAYRNRPPQRPHHRKSMLILQAGCERLGKHPKGAWDPPCLDVSFMVPQSAELTRLRALVREAFNEGIANGGTPFSDDYQWSTSTAKRRLEEGQ